MQIKTIMKHYLTLLKIDAIEKITKVPKKAHKRKFKHCWQERYIDIITMENNMEFFKKMKIE